MTTASLEQQLNAARQRVLKGESLPLEDQKELIALLRSNRFAAAEAGNSARTKKAASKGMSDQDLDSDLDNLLGSI